MGEKSSERQKATPVPPDTAETDKVYAFMNAIVENIPDMIFVKEAKELRFTRFNKAGEELLGHARESLLGKNDYDFFPKAEADFFTAKDREVLAKGKLLDIEEPIHTRFKGKRILHTKKVPIYDELGQPAYLLGISEDITEKKQAEEDRERLRRERSAREQSERALDHRDEFISIAAHELKTPLAALHIQVQLLNKVAASINTKEARKLCACAQKAQEQAIQFARLVDNLLDVTRARAGKLILERKPINLSETIRGVVERMEPELRKANCELKLNLEPSVSGVLDPVRVEQVLTNLISNAVKYGADKPVEVTVKTENTVAKVLVKDRGIGIPPKDQSKIFNRFERGVSAKDFRGLGLGLFITHHIVTAHGGKIRVDSEPGKGSTFIVELPLKLPGSTV